MKKIIAYVRVSDKNKDDLNNSIPKQIEQIKSWLQYKGLDTNIEIIEDSKVSGSKEGRKGFQELIAKLKTGDYSHLIVRDLSRLVRSVEIGSAFFNRIIFKNKIVFNSLEDNIDTSTAIGRFMLNIILAKDQYYRDQISEKVTRAIESKKSKGLSIGGHVPFGYQRGEDGRLLQIESQQETINLIFKLKNEGRSFNDIRLLLNKLEVESPNSEEWHVSTIRRIYINSLNRTSRAS